ncbi:P-loop containing nucleoside triphosphate hydrolase protein [Crepidotus variabilis]|uniref:P-loop containing nucleoside triphosphate hydrolase protein n=1 Tax=Crepidotus variabilis TaxID=179855 RepID=A0A9P6ETQ9_9AGAR|nr:P-loop containing nucleoside triphosphate hydrolase protein [Crepidotus variabilis]
MPSKPRQLDMSVDDLLKRQGSGDTSLRQREGPVRKRRRIVSEPEDPDQSGSSASTTSHSDLEDANVSGAHNDKSYSEFESVSDEEFDEEISQPVLEVEDRFRRTTSSRASHQPIFPEIQRSPSSNRSSFASLGVSAPLISALKGMSIKVPTEVQEVCIPQLIAGRDCIGNAKTGSGKTIAFALPILQRLSADPYGIFALVLTPTRELAFQISEQFAVLGAPLNVRTAVVVGGMDMMAQSLELGNRPHVVIATPGRLVDHLKSTSGEWDLTRVKFLVLDEADRMLTPTFTPELEYLFNILPRDRQTCLFTATLTPSIESLASATPRPGKQPPFVHRTRESVETVASLKQHYILVPSHVREVYLYHILCNPPESTLHLRRVASEPTKVKNAKGRAKTPKNIHRSEDEPEQPPPTIIFCAKPRTAAYLTLLLKTLSIRSTALHSRLTQRERLNSLSLFRAAVVPVLVSTDVGARGLDIEDVALVINWDLPSEPEEYTHRVGRTARAGKGGLAISFVTERDEERVLSIEARIRTKLDEMNLAEDKVLNQLNAVSTAKRLANMELHDSNFGKREEIHKIKSAKRRLPETEDAR